MPTPTVKPHAPLTAAQQEVVTLLLAGHDLRGAAYRLGIGYTTAHNRVRLAANKVPGDLPDPCTKLIVWSRGATKAVLGVK